MAKTTAKKSTKAAKKQKVGEEPKKGQEQENTTATKQDVLAKAIALTGQLGWFDGASVAALERTCRAGGSNNGEWCCQSMWKPIAIQTWPHLLVKKEEEDDDDDDDDQEKKKKATTAIKNEDDDEVVVLMIGGEEITTTYKSLFTDPRLWLGVSAEHVKRLPKWSEMTHKSIIECGRCGCNCNNGGCPGIPITSQYRWEKKEKLGWPGNRMDVPSGEGYLESGCGLVAVNHFCDPCFQRLVNLNIGIQQEDYAKIEGTTLYDTVTTEMIDATTERSHDNNGGRRRNPRVYYTPFFASGYEWSWQELNKKVNADDVAIVVANALIHKDCQTRHLQLDGLHFNDPGLGYKGYKALALALSINKTVRRIDFFQDFGEEGCQCCDDGDDTPLSYGADKSKGFLLKALQHNKKSVLRDLRLLCSSAFGPQTWKAWKAVKPGLRCGPELPLECYADWKSYHHNNNARQQRS